MSRASAETHGPRAREPEAHESLLQMRGIVKTFPGVRALDGVDLDVRPGEVHCLLGQNGAGKSTLIKVLAGAHRPDEGEIEWRGEAGHAGQPARGDRARHLHDLPGARPRRRPQRRREHLPRPRDVALAACIRRSETRRTARALLEAARPQRDPRRPRGRHAARVRPADRPHGASAVPRHPADRDGRAVGRAGPAGGADPLPGDPRPDRARAWPWSTSRTGSRRSARSATGSPSSRTAARSRPTCRPGTPRPAS